VKPVSTLVLGGFSASRKRASCRGNGRRAMTRQTRRVARKVLAGPERVDAEQDRGRVAAKLLGERCRAAVHSLGEQHDAFVFDMRPISPATASTSRLFVNRASSRPPVSSVRRRRRSARRAGCSPASYRVGVCARARAPPDGGSRTAKRRCVRARRARRRGRLATVVGKRAGHAEGGADQHAAAQPSRAARARPPPAMRGAQFSDQARAGPSSPAPGPRAATTRELAQ